MTPTVDGVAILVTLALVGACVVFAKVQQTEEPEASQHALTLAAGLLLATMAAIVTSIVQAGVWP